MTKLNLGRVVGQDAGFGNVSSTYTNNGGEPSVNISLSGENAAKDWQFDFQNITEDPLTSSEVEQICNDKIINTTKKLSGTGLMVLWNQIKAKFAAKSHKHGSADITSVNGTVIEDSTVGLAKLDADANKKLSDMEKGIADNAASWDSLSQHIITKEVNIKGACEGNGVVDINLNPPVVEGYKCLGIINWQVGSIWLYTYRVGWSHIYARNLASGEASYNASATFLYVRN